MLWVHHLFTPGTKFSITIVLVSVYNIMHSLSVFGFTVSNQHHMHIWEHFIQIRLCVVTVYWFQFFISIELNLNVVEMHICEHT